VDSKVVPASRVKLPPLQDDRAARVIQNRPRMTAIKVTREELYEQVWTTPMTRLALNYGISDVALAKTCRRMNIPRPGRGYWQRVKAHVKVKRTPLPKVISQIFEAASRSGQRERAMRRPVRGRLVVLPHGREPGPMRPARVSLRFGAGHAVFEDGRGRVTSVVASPWAACSASARP
jgi:hypothetical protein